MEEAAILALNRLGIKPVGVFFWTDEKKLGYVLLPHKTMDTVIWVNQRLHADPEYASKGKAFLTAPNESKAFERIESSLLLAFVRMPAVETPVRATGRVFQLRIYKSPSVLTGWKKIEMFNDAGEIKIFREVGLNPVFFGEAIVGSEIPNLTYMLVFESKAEQDASWRKFGQHPEW